ncbi:hypothetical protein [Methylobacterium sp. Leaf456]|uniref:hypothetical protein n=1 Tax=Methylobacterium sp. Leaf456 TaxID=1736382 RepID=UPI0012E34B29|nr:hypothetical protein [Methylobacterium sp. Leaf456]
MDSGRAVSISIFADEMDGSPASSLYYAMKNTVADKSIASVGGLVAVASSRIDGFRFSSFCDLLYDWPMQKDDEYTVNLDEPITYSSSAENSRYSLSHIPSGFLNANFLAFYFIKGNLLYVFYGRYNGLARQCYSETGVAPGNIYNTISRYFGFDLNWLVWVFSGLPADLSVVGLDVPGATGVRTGFICHANTHSDDKKQAIMYAHAPPCGDD